MHNVVTALRASIARCVEVKRTCNLGRIRRGLSYQVKFIQKVLIKFLHRAIKGNELLQLVRDNEKGTNEQNCHEI